MAENQRGGRTLARLLSVRWGDSLAIYLSIPIAALMALVGQPVSAVAFTILAVVSILRLASETYRRWTDEHRFEIGAVVLAHVLYDGITTQWL